MYIFFFFLCFRYPTYLKTLKMQRLKNFPPYTFKEVILESEMKWNSACQLPFTMTDSCATHLDATRRNTCLNFGICLKEHFKKTNVYTHTHKSASLLTAFDKLIVRHCPFSGVNPAVGSSILFCYDCCPQEMHNLGFLLR